jgi:hypothetical protein
MRQASPGHNLMDRNAFKSVAIADSARSQQLLLEMNPVARHYGLVEGKPGFGAVPEGPQCHIGVMRMVLKHAEKRTKKEKRRKT